eukprot:GHVT01058975.1.p1 GENE.GHVT01058975.1~~GHVT01058975.1.p1  ORF type:complete len:246 (+),score=7.81 GHVT01058975.1:818-1555(+)
MENLRAGSGSLHTRCGAPASRHTTGVPVRIIQGERPYTTAGHHRAWGLLKNTLLGLLPLCAPLHNLCSRCLCNLLVSVLHLPLSGAFSSPRAVTHCSYPSYSTCPHLPNNTHTTVLLPVLRIRNVLEYSSSQSKPHGVRRPSIHKQRFPKKGSPGNPTKTVHGSALLILMPLLRYNALRQTKRHRQARDIVPPICWFSLVTLRECQKYTQVVKLEGTDHDAKKALKITPNNKYTTRKNKYYDKQT